MSADQPMAFDTNEIEQAFGRLAGPTHLPSLTAQERQRFLTEQLTPWVEQLVVRFGLDTRTIPPCWARHNGMVEALSALRDQERACYSETAAPTAALDWFRALREIEARLIDQGAGTRCSITEHRESPAARWTGQPR